MSQEEASRVMNLKFAVGIAEFLLKPSRTWAIEEIRFIFLFT